MTNPTSSYSINYPLLKLQTPIALGHQPGNEVREKVLGHSSKVLLACGQCNYKTEQRRHLDRHIECVHKKLKNFACDQCDHRASQKDLLDRHVKAVHLKIKDWACGQCAFKTARKSGLKNHVKSVHENIRDFACDKCNYRAAQQKHLKAHLIAAHLITNNFACEQCDHKSPKKDLLNRHVKEVHGKVKDWACGRCAFRTARKSGLMHHVRLVHENIKDFACDKCNYRSTKKQYLKGHIMAVHSQRTTGKVKNIIEDNHTWACGQCDHKAVSEDDLQMHLKVSHNREKDSGESTLTIHEDAMNGINHLKPMSEKANEATASINSHGNQRNLQRAPGDMQSFLGDMLFNVPFQGNMQQNASEMGLMAPNVPQTQVNATMPTGQDSIPPPPPLPYGINDLTRMHEKANEATTSVISHGNQRTLQRAPGDMQSFLGDMLFNVPFERKLYTVGNMQQNASVMAPHIPQAQVYGTMPTGQGNIPPPPPMTWLLTPEVSLTRQPLSSTPAVSSGIYGKPMPLPAPAPTVAGNNYWPATLSLVPKMPDWLLNFLGRNNEGRTGNAPGDLTGLQAVKEEARDITKYLGCEDCDYKALDQRPESLASHKAVIHGDGPVVKCNRCDYQTSRKMGLLEHLASAHGIGQFFNCDLCDYKSPSYTVMRRHKKTVHKEVKSDSIQPKTTQESNDIEKLNSSGICASSSAKPMQAEQEPLVPVARKAAARMGVPTRREELGHHMYYRLPKCEECGLHFTTDTMQRHKALVHRKMKLEKGDTSVELKNSPALNMVEKNSQPMNASMKAVYEDIKNENGIQYENTSHGHHELQQNLQEVEKNSCLTTENQPINAYIKAVHEEVKNESSIQYESTSKCQDELQQNVKVLHDNVGNLQCTRCNYKASRKANLTRHIQVVHEKIKDKNVKYLKCGQCDHEGRQDNIQRHINVVHNKMKFKCGQCDYKNARQDKLRRHVKAAHEMTKDSSSDLSDDKASQKVHLEAHTVAKESKIELTSFKEHEYETVDESKFNQDVQTVPDKVQDTIHINDNGGFETKQNTPNEEVMQKQVITPSPPMTAQLEMPALKLPHQPLSQDAKTSAPERAPVKTKSGNIRNWNCGQCEYKSKRQDNLNIHIKAVHEKIRDWICGQCDFKTAREYTLHRHVKNVHEKIKSWSCSQCDFKSSQKESLRRHVKNVHEKIKSWSCDHCDFKASQKVHLKTHIRGVHVVVEGGATGNTETAIKLIWRHMQS